MREYLENFLKQHKSIPMPKFMALGELTKTTILRKKDVQIQKKTFSNKVKKMETIKLICLLSKKIKG